jgi:peptide/nickel transport system ATP-binding protein
MTEPILSVRDLVVEYGRPPYAVRAVRGVSFDLYPHESLALVGESGCGKTTLGLALLRLLPKLGRTPEGSVRYRRADGGSVDLLSLRNEELRRFRWNDAAMVFQGAMNALNPVLRVADQMHDTIGAHRRMSRAEARKRCVEVLEMVRLDPARVLHSYPHELSGGMRQRVLIAMALACRPQLIVADEPVTALDVMTQAQILDLLRSLSDRLELSMILISHDLSVIAEVCDSVNVMYAGKIVETGPTSAIFAPGRLGAAHPYTARLRHAFPDIRGERAFIEAIPGYPPDLAAPPPGCRFADRCTIAVDRCRTDEPALEPVGADHEAACHLSAQVLGGTVLDGTGLGGPGLGGTS